MKKSISILLIVLITLFGIVALTSCDDTEQKGDGTVYHTVKIDLDGGDADAVDFDTELKIKDGTVFGLSEYVPVKRGYDFAGYETDGKVYEKNDTITITSDVTFKAVWKKTAAPKSFKVTFDSVGGTLAQSLITVDEGSVINLGDYIPQKESYSFDGWKLGDTLYEKNARITVSEDITLVAQWTEISGYCEVIFDTAGGSFSGNVTVLRVKKGTELSLSEYVPKKWGYKFSGWVLGGEIYACDDKITVGTSITLEAQWTEIPRCRVTFDTAGGEIENDYAKIKEGGYIRPSDYVPNREGYDFVGWKAPNGTVYNGARTYRVTGDVTFTAEWVSSASNFKFELSEDGKSYIISGLADDFGMADVIVPGTYDGKPVTAIGGQVFQYNKIIKSIDFRKCTSLVTIESWNFVDCPNLESVDLGGCSKLEKISGCCFMSLPKLTTLNFKGLSGLKEIGHSVFSYVGKETYTPVEVIDFSDCISLETIGEGSFWFLSGVKVLDFSNTKLNSIGRQVIKYCTALETIGLPSTLDYKNIDYEFITHTDKLKEIKVDPLNIYLCTENGILYNIDKTILFKAPAEGMRAEYKAPSTLKEIKPQAFYNVKNLLLVDLTECTLETIGWEAFSGCSDAVIKVPFNRKNINNDGVKVNLGQRWNYNVNKTEYSDVIEITVIGIPDSNYVTKGEISADISAKYGAEICTVTVKLNNEIVAADDSGKYILKFSVGENILEITANSGEKTSSRKYKVTRVVGDPTVTATISDGVVSWYDSTLDFVITAKDAAGNALTKSSIEIWYYWGYGPYSHKQTNGVILNDNADGTISASVSYDFYYDNLYIDGDTEITLTIVVNDGALSKSVSYKVDWREKAPSLNVTTTLENGLQSDKNTPVEFTVTAKGILGNNLDSSAVTINFRYDYYGKTMEQRSWTDAYTLTDNSNGTIGVSVDLSKYADWGMFDWENKNVTFIIIVKDGSVEKTLEYTISWVEI